MITVRFDDHGRLPKYEQLYRHIRDEIITGAMAKGDRLPSKRSLADHLRVSVNTVETAYAQLLAEGFIESEVKRGYFVLPVLSGEHRFARPASAREPAVDGAPLGEPSGSGPGVARTPPAPGSGVPAPLYDLKNNAVDTESFPFATWSRLMRESLREDRRLLLEAPGPQGDPQLREAICDYLREYRDIRVSPEQVVLGAGTSHLVGVLTELLPGAKFAVENPGYSMMPGTLHNRGVAFEALDMDSEGMRLDLLRRSGASVCLLTPSNQFPRGTTMSVERRAHMLRWAGEAAGRYLIEDDYDSDYRYALKPAPALCRMDRDERVVYLNTFARTLAPSLRIAYMVLPRALLAEYLSRGRHYSCTVSGFEQRTLWRFIRGGHYERHLNRMRTIYKKRRNALLEGLAPLAGKLEISGTDAGLHLLLRSATGVTETGLSEAAAVRGVRVHGLSGFHHGPVAETHTVVAGYGGLDEPSLREAAVLLVGAWADAWR